MTAVLQALNAPRRRELLRLVWDGERTAGELHRALGDVTFGAVSQHLRVLEAAHLVDVRRAGRFRWYRARKEELGALAEWLESMWGSALDRLALEAELEAARRGPRAGFRRSSRASAPQPSRKKASSSKIQTSRKKKP